MAFAKSERALVRRDHRPLIATVVALILLAGWVGWLTAGRVTVYVRSDEATTEASSSAPSNDLRVVGLFPAATAIGRLEPGQPAIMRLSAFPWTEYGVLHARVSKIATEAKDGAVRVELDVEQGSERIPSRQGLLGSLEVEVESLRPWQLILRAAGELLAPKPKTTPRHEPS